MTTKQPKLSAPDKSFRRQAACAVLTGIYAAHGCEILEADREERALAIRTAARVALQQADELLRRERESEAAS